MALSWVQHVALSVLQGPSLFLYPTLGMFVFLGLCSCLFLLSPSDDLGYPLSFIPLLGSKAA